MEIAYGLDPDQGLGAQEQAALARDAAALGYAIAWTPSRADEAAFERCLGWHEASGLPVAIGVVPASGRPPEFYAGHAARLRERTGGRFTLGVGSGSMARPAIEMRAYLAELRASCPPEMPIYLAALGPAMLRLAGELADGVALNWCDAAQVAWSREIVARGAAGAGRGTPRMVAYIRTAVDPDVEAARRVLLRNALGYAFGPPGYRHHFERMGMAGDLGRFRETGEGDTAALAAAVGAAGAPGAVQPQVARLAAGLDQAIVRVLVTRPASIDSARRVLEECAATPG